MTTSRAQWPLPDENDDAVLDRLEQENAQLRYAVGSHATVDQAIGVLIAFYRLSPADGFEVLREVSQHTNIKLRTVAEAVIAWAFGQPLPQAMTGQLNAAVGRRRAASDSPS
ncbi:MULTISPECIES: ANTAR domain-containing protein [Actinomycetes]|uniref:ANTAR domain-containing protein n=1 Tax=Actinomycetes TaxID=1760 RepID=UPI00364460C8